MRSHSLVADFGAIVHWREPDNPVKDGALSKPFFRLPNKRSAQKAFTEKTRSGHGKALTRVQKFALLAFRRHCVLTIPMGAFYFFFRKNETSRAEARLRIFIHKNARICAMSANLSVFFFSKKSAKLHNSATRSVLFFYFLDVFARGFYDVLKEAQAVFLG